MGLFSSKQKIPAQGFYAMPSEYQGFYNSLLGQANSFFNPQGGFNVGAFTPEGAGYESLLKGFAPTQASLASDIQMQMNPYNDQVISEINRQAQGPMSALNRNMNAAGQFGSNRGMLGANDIDLSRTNQIGQFLGGQYNNAMQNAMTTLPGLRQQDALNNLQYTMMGKQAPMQAIQAGQGILGGFPSQFGGFGNQAYTVKSGGLGGILGGLGQIAQIAGPIAMAASDERLKENIVPVGQKNGLNVYKFNYKSNPDRTFVGVMAQEVQKTHPNAVVDHDGYLCVDYAQLGFMMEEVA